MSKKKQSSNNVEEKRDLNKEARLSYCDHVAYGVEYNVDKKEYELITLRYSTEVEKFVIESVEGLGSHGLAVDARVNMLFNVNKIKEEARK